MDIRIVEAFLNTFEDFCASPKMNVGKTICLFSGNVLGKNRQRIKNVLGVRVVNNLGHYLRISLQQRVSKSSYAYILDKMKTKIEGWNAANFPLLVV